MITLQNQIFEDPQFQNALGSLLKQKRLKIEQFYQIVKMAVAIEEQSALYSKVKTKLVSDYGTLDEKTKQVTVERDKMLESDWNTFTKHYTDLLKMTFDIDFEPLLHDETFDLEPGEVFILNDLITIPE